MNRTVARVSFGPNQQKQVFTGRTLVYLARKLAGGLCGFAVDFENDVAGLKAGIVRRAGGAHLLHHDSLYMVGNIQLLASILAQIGDGKSNLAALGGIVSVICCFLSFSVELAHSQVQCYRLSVAHHAHFQARTRRHFADRELQAAPIEDLFPIEFGDHVALTQAAFAGRRIRRYLRDNRARRSLQVKKVRVVRSNVVDVDAEITVRHRAHSGPRRSLQVKKVRVVRSNVVDVDAEITVLDLAMLDQLVCGTPDDLRRNCKAGTCERTAVRDNEGGGGAWLN